MTSEISSGVSMDAAVAGDVRSASSTFSHDTAAAFATHAAMETTAPAIPKSLFVFSIFYGGMVCVAGVLGNKLVGLGPLSALGPVLGLEPLGIEAGICAFLLLVIVS